MTRNWLPMKPADWAAPQIANGIRNRMPCPVSATVAKDDSASATSDTTVTPMSLGEASALLAAIGGAAAALVIWSLGETEPVARQMFYFSLFALLLSAVPLPWIWEWPTLAQLIPTIAVAAFTITGQFFYAKAFSTAPGDKVITWSYMAIVFAAGFGFLLWGEPISVLAAGGTVLVVGGAHLATRER